MIRRLHLSTFGIICLLWLVASALLPALGFYDWRIFMVLVFEMLPLAMVWPAGPFWALVLLWAIVPLLAAATAYRHLIALSYRSAALFSFVPVVGLLVFFFGRDLGDELRFRLDRSIYDRIVAEASQSGCAPGDLRRYGIAIDAVGCQPLTIVFLWGGFLSGWYGIVYDAGDEIMRPPDERSTAWRSRPIGDLLSCSRGNLALGDHYYRAGGEYSTFPGCTP